MRPWKTTAGHGFGCQHPFTSRSLGLRLFFFSAGVSERSVPQNTAAALVWLSDSPVRVDQWHLPRDTLSAAEWLVSEQEAAGHISPSFRPWNIPIFVIKKKSGLWMLLQDLQAVNRSMQVMGPLQPGLPSPT